MSVSLAENIGKVDSSISKILKDADYVKKVEEFFNKEKDSDKYDIILDKVLNFNSHNIVDVNVALAQLITLISRIIDKHDSLDIKIDGNCFKNKINTIYQVGLAIQNNIQIDFDIYKTLSFKSKIKSFKLLSDDWDSYGGLKTSKLAIDGALNFMETYKEYEQYLKYVYPSVLGAVGLEYKNNDIRIGFKIKNKESIEFYGFNDMQINQTSIKDFFNIITK